MDMTGEYRIPAPREKVWAALNDAEILRQSIPGCDQITMLSDTELTAKVTAKVGPVKASFTGKVTLSDLDPPNGYTISGEGTGGPAGFAKGGAKVSLVTEGTDTVLRYTAQANVGGKLAQIGSRLIDGTARKMADDFFGRFAAIVGAPEAAPTETIAEAVTDEEAAHMASVAEIADTGDEAPEAAMAVAAMTPETAAETSMAAALITSESSAPIAASPRGGLSPVVWVSGLVVIVGLLLWYFTSGR